MTRRIASLALVCLSIFALSTLGFAAPTPETRYAKSVMRLEARPAPMDVKDASARQSAERKLARAGINARWIEVVEADTGRPYIPNPYLPTNELATAENEAILKAWVKEMHDAGMAAVSWCGFSFCATANEKYPSWRQVPLRPWPQPNKTEKAVCCINTPFRQAMIDYFNYAIDRLDLDGIWFDGSAWTPIWETPLPVTCACDSCKARFKKDTGYDLPLKVDWKDPVFRKWVNWRYQVFGEAIGNVARQLRAKHPNIMVAINHYHRTNIPWQSAVPIDLYNADIISASEASGLENTDIVMRLCRAYGRGSQEVWRPFNVTGTIEQSVEPMIHHALQCYNAGGDPSFGGGRGTTEALMTALMTPIMNEIHPYVGGPIVPYAALHLSQQTETFHFGQTDFGWASNPYWTTINNWTSGLGANHLPPDYVYDSALTAKNLSRYKALLMPASLALSESQAKVALDFARKGGVLVLGVGAGEFDSEAQPLKSQRFEKALGLRFGEVPASANWVGKRMQVTSADGKTSFTASAISALLNLSSPEWKMLFETTNVLVKGTTIITWKDPVIASRPYGKGMVLAFAIDPNMSTSNAIYQGGKTSLTVADDTAASGRYSLKYVDDPDAPGVFFPDMETNITPFGSTDSKGGILQFDIQPDAATDACIEVRSTLSKVQPFSLCVGPAGMLTANGRAVHALPLGQWSHIEVTWDFAADAKTTATFMVTAQLPDGTTKTSSPLPPYFAGFKLAESMVIYGCGDKPATFHIDNVVVEAVLPDSSRRLILANDFEDGPDSLKALPVLATIAAGVMKTHTPPAVSVEALDTVRAGYFEGKAHGIGPFARKSLWVHLYNSVGERKDWKASNGPAATINCRFAVKSARSLTRNESLGVSRMTDYCSIIVPSIGLYDVIEVIPE